LKLASLRLASSWEHETGRVDTKGLKMKSLRRNRSSNQLSSVMEGRRLPIHTLHTKKSRRSWSVRN
jgi:hypothetical protein